MAGVVSGRSTVAMRNIVVPYISIRSPGFWAPTLTASVQASIVPVMTGGPAECPRSPFWSGRPRRRATKAGAVSPGFTNTEGIGKGAGPEVAAAMTRQRDEIAMPPSAVASAISYAIEQPDGVDISEIVVRPTAQA